MKKSQHKILRFILLSFLVFQTSHASEDDLLDLIPPIIVAALSSVVVDSCSPNALEQLRALATLNVRCDIDLRGATVTLPSGVKLVFDGGKIINGTLILRSGEIDSLILNPSLVINGNVRLSNGVFEFNPTTWGIREVANSNNPIAPSLNVAIANHRIIQRVLNRASRLGADTFRIGKMDAFFGTPAIEIPVLELPSNFNLIMAGNTVFRVQPIDEIYSFLVISIFRQSNINVTGGVIIGDRLEHGPTDGGNTPFVIKGGQNIVVDGLTVRLSSSTGLTINSFLFEGQSGFIQSSNIKILNSLFDSNRNNNLSITDGDSILVQGNTMLRAGIDLPAKFGVSQGRAPRIGIVAEPVQGQVISNIEIRDNTINNGEQDRISILASDGDGFLIAGNRADGGVGWTNAQNVTVENNIIDGGGIIGGFSTQRFDLRFGYIVRDNIIRNNRTGTCVELTNDDIQFYNNQVINCNAAIRLRNLRDSEIYNNTFSSNRANSFGLLTLGSVDNVLVRDNNFNILGRAISINGLNTGQNEAGFSLVVRDNEFTSGNDNRVASARGVEFLGNTFKQSGIGFGNSRDINFNDNTVENTRGISLVINRNSSSQNMRIANNVLNNLSNNRLTADGIRVNTVGGGNLAVENSGVVITDNEIRVAGQNYGIRTIGFDGMTITNNDIISREIISGFWSIFLTGNNSTITGNQVNNQVVAEGSGNTVNNNSNQ